MENISFDFYFRYDIGKQKKGCQSEAVFQVITERCGSLSNREGEGEAGQKDGETLPAAHRAPPPPPPRPLVYSTYCAKVLSWSGVSLMSTMHSSCWKIFSLAERLFSSMPLMCRPRVLATHTHTHTQWIRIHGGKHTYMPTLVRIYESTSPSAFPCECLIDDCEFASVCVCVCVCVCAYRPLREEQYGITWIPRGAQSPGNSTTFVRVLSTKHTHV